MNYGTVHHGRAIVYMFPSCTVYVRCCDGSSGIGFCSPLRVPQAWLDSDHLQRCGAASINNTRQHHQCRGMCWCRVGHHLVFNSFADCKLALFLSIFFLFRSVLVKWVSCVGMLVLMFMAALLERSASNWQRLTTQMKATVMQPKSESKYSISFQYYEVSAMRIEAWVWLLWSEAVLCCDHNVSRRWCRKLP